MGKLLKFSILVLVVAAVCCSPDKKRQDSGTTEIRVTPNPVVASGDGEAITLTVEADDEWGIFTTVPWATCTPTGGVKGSTSVTLTVAANPSSDSQRTAEVTVKAGSERFPVTLTQGASTPKPPPPPPPPPDPNMFVPEGYDLTWSDEFEGTTLDTDNWTPEIGTGSGGWGNAELQYYTSRPENLRVEDGTLVITARKENYNGATATSARLITMGKVYFKYGYVVASIRLPKTADGLWPAFWMMGNDFPTTGWPRCGETDILEMGNSTGIAAGTQERYLNGACHWGQSHANHVTNPYSLQDGEFHTYTCVWDQNFIRMYIDREERPDAAPYFEMRITDNMGGANCFRKENFLLLNLAVGGNFPGIHSIAGVTALASGRAEMEVDYVRVFQKK